MTLSTVILVETSSAGNLGAAMRVAANFGVQRLHLVRPRVAIDDPEILRWACGGDQLLQVACFESLEQAGADVRTLVATASGRGRENQPLLTPAEAAERLAERGLRHAAVVFGNETSGLRKEELDVCDMALRIPTEEAFPVLNLTQSVAIVLATLSMGANPPEKMAPVPAPLAQVQALMQHLETSLLAIDFLDPVNPDRMLRKLRRMIGRAGITENEVAMMRGICRQILWAAEAAPLAKRDERD